MPFFWDLNSRRVETIKCTESSCTGNGWRISDEEAALPAQVVGHQGVARTRNLQGQRRLLVHILPGGKMKFLLFQCDK
jgi:hypothetical protein